MLDQKDIKNLNDIFKDYDYVMTTAQLSSVMLYLSKSHIGGI